MTPPLHLSFRRDDLTGAEIRALIEHHLAGMHANSPPESVHAFEVDQLRQPGVTFWSAWLGEALVGCGALKRLDARRGELKSMRVADGFIGRGMGRAILNHLVREARALGLSSLWLETGSGPAFAPALGLYERAGFTRTGPFGSYAADPFSVFMTRPLGPSFVHYVLQSTAPSAAESFYAHVFGDDFWGRGVAVTTLPERAARMGAPAHWLGHVRTGDVEQAAMRMIALGGQQLGPTQTRPDGAHAARLRDPFGAVLAVCSEESASGPSPVVWHLHHGNDPDKTATVYADLFGWTSTLSTPIGVDGWRHRPFSWDEASSPAGALASTAGRPHVHPHWLFFFGVDDLDAAAARVVRHGGRVSTRIETPDGANVAPCEDPQGAAFALQQCPV
jgi:putative acetyltransferase